MRNNQSRRSQQRTLGGRELKLQRRCDARKISRSEPPQHTDERAKIVLRLCFEHVSQGLEAVQTPGEVVAVATAYRTAQKKKQIGGEKRQRDIQAARL